MRVRPTDQLVITGAIYILGELITGMKESALKKAIAVLIKIRFAFTGF